MLYHQPINYAGPGLWIRIQHRFGPRLTEWMLASITLLWGAVILLPADTFAQPAYTYFRFVFGNEVFLGSVMLMLGVARLGGLIVNGARKHVTPRIRRVSAAVGFLIWVGMTCAHAMSGMIGVWLAFYPIFAAVEVVNVYRAAHDVGENSRGLP